MIQPRKTTPDEIYIEEERKLLTAKDLKAHLKEHYYTSAEVKEILDIVESTLYRWINEGILVPKHYKHKNYFPKRMIDAFIRDHMS